MAYNTNGYPLSQAVNVESFTRIFTKKNIKMSSALININIVNRQNRLPTRGLTNISALAVLGKISRTALQLTATVRISFPFLSLRCFAG